MTLYTVTQRTLYTHILTAQVTADNREEAERVFRKAVAEGEQDIDRWNYTAVHDDFHNDGMEPALSIDEAKAPMEADYSVNSARWHAAAAAHLQVNADIVLQDYDLLSQKIELGEVVAEATAILKRWE